MTQKELSKRLWGYPYLEDKLCVIFSEIAAINARADTLRGVRSPVLDGFPHGNGVSDPTYKAARIIIDEYDIQMNTLLDSVKKTEADIQLIKRLLRLLTDDERKVIEMRYFKQIKIDYMPAHLYWSRRKCFYLHEQAFKKMLEAI